MSADSDQILAKGAAITLRDGRTLRLRYGFLAIKELERRFGSTSALDRELRGIAGFLQGQQIEEERVFSSVFDVLAAGLIHEHLTDEQIDELLDFRDLHALAVAANQALGEAFGEISDEEAAKQGKAPARKRAGRGVNGGTRRPSPSAETTPPSGG